MRPRAEAKIFPRSRRTGILKKLELEDVSHGQAQSQSEVSSFFWNLPPNWVEQ